MHIFISWSGSRSKEVAKCLRHWLRMISDRFDPWMSDQDIQAGSFWQANISEQLATSALGIVCVTADNWQSPWMVFEAGALSNSISDARTKVIPYLLDHESPADLQGPLSQFQVVLANREGTYRMVRAANDSLAQAARREKELDELFERLWPDLSTKLNEIRESDQKPPQRTDQREMTKEILTLVRRLTSDQLSQSLPDLRKSLAKAEQQLASTNKLISSKEAELAELTEEAMVRKTGEPEMAEHVVYGKLELMGYLEHKDRLVRDIATLTAKITEREAMLKKAFES